MVDVNDKVLTLSEAAKIVNDGCNICFADFACYRNTIAFAHELIRQKKRNLNIVGGSMPADLLHGAGVAKSGGGFTLDRFGRLERIDAWQRSLKEPSAGGSMLTGDLRYHAGALGIPYIPTTSLLGTDVPAVLERQKPDQYKVSTCPFTGKPLLLLRAQTPDVTVIHAHEADTEGNTRIDGPLYLSDDMAKAAKRLIVTVEEITSPEITKRDPERTIIPGYMVDAIVQAPYGAHPTAMYRLYDYDSEHLMLYQKAAKTQEGFDKYLEEWILGVDDWFGYLQKVGVKKLIQLRADRLKGYSNLPIGLTGFGV